MTVSRTCGGVAESSHHLHIGVNRTYAHHPPNRARAILSQRVQLAWVAGRERRGASRCRCAPLRTISSSRRSLIFKFAAGGSTTVHWQTRRSTCTRHVLRTAHDPACTNAGTVRGALAASALRPTVDAAYDRWWSSTEVPTSPRLCAAF